MEIPINILTKVCQGNAKVSVLKLLKNYECCPGHYLIVVYVVIVVIVL